jgi:hypothetical protein
MIRLKENAPELGLQLVLWEYPCWKAVALWRRFSLLITWLRTRFHEETLLLIVFQFPFVVRTPRKPNLVSNGFPDRLKGTNFRSMDWIKQAMKYQ